MGANRKIYVEKPGDSFGRFQKAVKKILSVPKAEIDRREAEYQATRKATKKRA
ncbi:MAG: hypothetical protein AABN33_25315 [Acidobacteriota bacterium]